MRFSPKKKIKIFHSLLRIKIFYFFLEKNIILNLKKKKKK